MANSLIANYGSLGVVDNTTSFIALVGNIGVNQSSEALVEDPIREAGTFNNLFTYVPTNTASVSSTITLRKSLADTALTVTYTSDQTGVKEDTSNSVLFAATDEVDYEVTVPTEGGTNTLTITALAVQFAPTTTGNCFTILARTGVSPIDATSTSVFHVPNGLGIGTLDESLTKYRIRTAVTSSNFYTNVSVNGRSSSTVYRTRKSAANGNQTVTYTSSQTGVKEDTSNTDSLAAGDDYNYVIEYGTGTGTLTTLIIATRIISTSNFFPLLTARPQESFAANTVRYLGVSGNLDLPTTTEANSQVYPRFDFTASELGAYVSANAGVSLATNITLRDNGVGSALTIQYLAGQTGLKNDSVNTVAITSGTDEINYEITCLDLTGGITVTWMGILGETAAAAPPATIFPKSTLLFMGAG